MSLACGCVPFAGAGSTSRADDGLLECGAPARDPSGLAPQSALGDLWAWIHPSATARGFGAHFGSVGDIDGDGCDDLAVTAEDGVRLFLGPLGRGDWSADEHDAHFMPRSIDRPAHGADVNGDGVAEFWIGNELYSFDKGAATLVFEGGSGGAELVDADGDGAMDAVLSWSDSLVLAYGPLSDWSEPTLAQGCQDGLEVPPTAACIVMVDPTTGVPGATGVHDADVVADITGDDVPDIIAMDYGDFSEGRIGAAVYAGGDLRGQLLGSEPYQDVQNVLAPNFKPVLGDVDGNGVEDVALLGGIGESSELVDVDSAGADLDVQLPASELMFPIVVSSGDMDRDGITELRTTVDGDVVLFAGNFSGELPSDSSDDGAYTVVNVLDGAGAPVIVAIDIADNPDALGDSTGDGGTDIVVLAPKGDGVVVIASDDLFPP